MISSLQSAALAFSGLLFLGCSEYSLPELGHSPDPDLPYKPMIIVEGIGTKAINLFMKRAEIEAYAGKPYDSIATLYRYKVENAEESAIVDVGYMKDRVTPDYLAFRSDLSVVAFFNEADSLEVRPGIHFDANKRIIDSLYPPGLKTISSEVWVYRPLGVTFTFLPDGSLNFIGVLAPKN